MTANENILSFSIEQLAFTAHKNSSPYGAIIQTMLDTYQLDNATLLKRYLTIVNIGKAKGTGKAQWLRFSSHFSAMAKDRFDLWCQILRIKVELKTKESATLPVSDDSDILKNLVYQKLEDLGLTIDEVGDRFTSESEFEKHRKALESTVDMPFTHFAGWHKAVDLDFHAVITEVPVQIPSEVRVTEAYKTLFGPPDTSKADEPAIMFEDVECVSSEPDHDMVENVQSFLDYSLSLLVYQIKGDLDRGSVQDFMADRINKGLKFLRLSKPHRILTCNYKVFDDMRSFLVVVEVEGEVIISTFLESAN